MKTINLLAVILFMAFTSLNINAQNGKSKGNIILKGKTYVRISYPYDIDYAYNVIVTIVNIEENKTTDFTKKYGRFRKELEPDQKYMIYISKEGYETKSFEVSTAGAVPEYKYLLNFDIILKKKEIADYNSKFPVLCVNYNGQYNYFVYKACD
ncbi:MAG: hypothetical protein ABII90_10935 [Bacteroidota bacterium]